jgi:hypothetical protein
MPHAVGQSKTEVYTHASGRPSGVALNMKKDRGDDGNGKDPEFEKY